MNLNSFNEKMQLLVPAEDVVKGDAESALFDSSTHAFDENMKVRPVLLAVRAACCAPLTRVALDI